MGVVCCYVTGYVSMIRCTCVQTLVGAVLDVSDCCSGVQQMCPSGCAVLTSSSMPPRWTGKEYMDQLWWVGGATYTIEFWYVGG